jgi:DNA-binding Lrp family transcriptional regulator
MPSLLVGMCIGLVVGGAVRSVLPESFLRILLTVAILAPAVTQLEDFFNYIVSESKVPVTDLQLQVRNGWHFFGAKYLTKGSKQEPVHIVPSGKALELSPEDGKVLHVFSNSAGGVLSQMAREAGMPVATFAYRLERIRDLGLIPGVRYQVAPEMVGYAPYRALVMTSLPLTAPRMQIMECASQNPYVVTMMHGVGLWQYELRIEAPNYATASMVVDELTERFSSVVESVELMPVLKVLKMELHPDHVLANKARASRRGTRRQSNSSR